jgi:hypothetical protein
MEWGSMAFAFEFEVSDDVILLSFSYDSYMFLSYDLGT